MVWLSNSPTPARRLTSSLVTCRVQSILRILLSHLCKRTSNLDSSPLVILQLSHPNSNTDTTLDFNNFTLVLVKILVFLHTLLSLKYAAHAFPILFLMSSAAPPVLLTSDPRYVKLLTSSISSPTMLNLLMLLELMHQCLFLAQFGLRTALFCPAFFGVGSSDWPEVQCHRQNLGLLAVPSYSI